MRTYPGILKTASSVLALAGSLALSSVPSLSLAADTSVIDQGKAVSFDRKKGNCLACHQIAGGKLPGNIGPPLVTMKARFPDKAKLRAQIWDATAINPHSIMPPLGRHRILSEKEVDLVTDYIYSL